MGIIKRLFYIIFYLALFPVHLLMYLIAGGLSLLAMLVLDVPIWIVTGKSDLVGRHFTNWAFWHLDRMF